MLTDILYKSIVIVLVNYNNWEDTEFCLKSLMLHGNGCSIVVVDNNSSISFIDEAKAKYHNVIFIKNGENLGFGRANNAGIDLFIKERDNKYFFILNNDTTIADNCIEKLVEVLDQNRYLGIVTPRIVFMDDPNTLWYGGADINWKRCTVNAPGYCQSAYSTTALTPRLVSFASGCAMLVRREVFEKVGGFDDRFFMYVEDLEFCIRVAKEGWKIKYVPDALVYHKCQGSKKTEGPFYPIDHPQNPNLPFYLYHLTKNRLITMFLHARGINALKFWTYYPIHTFAKSIQYLLNKRFDGVKAIIKGAFDSINVYFFKKA